MKLSNWKPAFVALVWGALVVAGWPGYARAADRVDAFARVVVEETSLRSGPGVSHRVVYIAHRGETFIVESRKGSGFWLKVVMPDGRSGWVV